MPHLLSISAFVEVPQARLGRAAIIPGRVPSASAAMVREIEQRWVAAGPGSS